MNKRLISLLLVVMLVITLLPMTVLADETEVGTVKVNVYGQAISDALFDENTTLSNVGGMITEKIQDALAGEHLPDCDIVLISKDKTEYELEKGNGEFIQSFDIRRESVFENEIDKIVNKVVEKHGENSLITKGIKLAASFMKGGISELFNGVKNMAGSLIEETGVTALMNDFYVTYTGKNIPEGDYTLEVRAINGNGYKLWEPETGEVNNIAVKANSIIYTGYEKVFSAAELIKNDDKLGRAYSDLENKLNEINEHSDIQLKMPDVKAVFPGVWLKREDPGFKFIKTDLADKALPGADFLMVDRNETIKIVSAMVALGKDTFTNAMKLVGTDGFTWEELNILDAFIKENDDGTGKTLGLNPDEAKQLIATYWALVEASASQPIADFLEKDLRVPALLKATSDENGIVHFTEDSNITLVWTIDVLMKMAGITNDMIQNAEVPDGSFDNKNLEAIANTFLKVASAFSKDGTNVLIEGGERMKKFINDWVYPILQNDDIPDKFKQIMKILDPKSEDEELSWSKFIPGHAILTSKMPASDYILMEEKAPEGYMRNPFFYTIHLTWNTEEKDVSKWCYVTVADLGIIGPYLAENYYTFFRNNSFVSVADKILNNVIGKEDANVLNYALTTDDSVTAKTLSYWAKLLSANVAGDSENGSEEAMANELTQYVIKHGNNAQSLMQFAYQVANRGRAVISSEVNEEWHFYNFNDSIHTSYATKITALLNGAKESLKEENDTLVSSAVKKAIDTQINIIGKVDAAITTATASFTAAVKDATAKVAESVKENVKATAKSVVSSLLKRLFK